MNTDIIHTALSMVPDGRPGVTRFCQEVISELTGDPITREPERIDICTETRGGPNNPWGSKGKPR